jgi:very-short-patch-repair endonuclease
VLVEIDGWAYHRDLRAFVRDTARQNALVLAGWVVIRTTWYELTEDPSGSSPTSARRSRREARRP